MPLKTLVDETPSVNLTPMIDIIFQLIIFFMVGSRFTDFDERKIDLKIPEVSASTAPTASSEKFTIHITAGGQILLDNEPIKLDQLTKKLTAARRHNQGVGVLVRSDAGSRFQTVAEVLNACNLAGINNLAVSVRQGKGTLR